MAREAKVYTTGWGHQCKVKNNVVYHKYDTDADDQWLRSVLTVYEFKEEVAEGHLKEVTE
ncbi:hypothetical protein [Pectobacterium phage PcaP1EGY]